MRKFIQTLTVSIANLSTGLDGIESARLKAHKLRLWFFGWRLYKVTSAVSSIEWYLITRHKMPSYRYKTFIIHTGLKRINDGLFIWRDK